MPKNGQKQIISITSDYGFLRTLFAATETISNQIPIALDEHHELLMDEIGNKIDTLAYSILLINQAIPT